MKKLSTIIVFILISLVGYSQSDLIVESYSHSFATYDSYVYKHVTDSTSRQKMKLEFLYSAKKVVVTNLVTQEKQEYTFTKMSNEGGNETIYCVKDGIEYMWQFPLTDLGQVSLYYDKLSEGRYNKEIIYYYK